MPTLPCVNELVAGVRTAGGCHSGSRRASNHSGRRPAFYGHNYCCINRLRVLRQKLASYTNLSPPGPPPASNQLSGVVAPG